MSERTARLDHLLREEISAIISREIADPRVGFVTVTSVDVSPDLGHATVWVSAIGSDEDRRASMRALGRAMPFVRHRLGVLRLKRIPQLHLREDESVTRGSRVLRILRGLEAEEGGPGAEGAPPEPGSDALPTPGPARSLPGSALTQADPSTGGARDGRPRARRRPGAEGRPRPRR